MTDEEQLETAIQKEAAIFTHDTDFLRMTMGREHFGIIYVHQRKLSVGECISKLKVIAETTSLQEIRNRIIFL
jgi:predicted nuclease of predicted toxin-antitoxin system